MLVRRRFKVTVGKLKELCHSMGMSLKCKPIEPIPPDTRALGERLLAPTDPYRIIGEQLGDFICDQDFVHLYSTEGKPAESPAVLSLVTLFQFTENLSDRHAAAMVVKRIDWKYALHLPLTDAGFDFSVLCEFRQRLLTHHAEGLVFDCLLHKLKSMGLVKARGLQRTDALAVVAAVARLNRLELVYETLRCALNALARTDVAWLHRVVPQSFIERYGERAEAERLVTEKGTAAQAQTRQFAEQAGQDGLWLLARLNDPDTPHTLRALAEVATVQAVWQQQFVVVSAPQEAQPPRLALREHVVSGAATVSTPHDPEARYSEKRGVDWVGYKVHVTETVESDLPHIITDIQTTPAPVSDEQHLPVIQKNLEHRELAPTQQIVDAGYMSGKNIATSADHDIELIGRVHADGSPQAHLPGGITCDQFEIDWVRRVAHCPAGHTSVSWSETTDHGQPVTHVGFATHTCAACSLYARCVLGKKEKPRGRRLKLRAYHAQVRAQREKQTQAPLQRLYRQRAGIEATLSMMVRAQGLRRTRYVGLLKTHLRNLFIAAARNLRRCARWLMGERPKARGRGTIALTVKATPQVQSACA